MPMLDGRAKERFIGYGISASPLSLTRLLCVHDPQRPRIRTQVDRPHSSTQQERKVVMTDGNGTLPWLKTDGNKIVTEDGQEVILRGANIMRAEWDWFFGKSMDWENKAIPELATNWHGNVLTRGFASDPVNSGDAD